MRHSLSDTAGASFGTAAVVGFGCAIAVALAFLLASAPANAATLTAHTIVEPMPVSITTTEPAGITLSSEDIEAYCESFGLTLAECRFEAVDVQQWLQERNAQ